MPPSTSRPDDRRRPPFGDGGGYYGHSRYGASGLGGVLGLILVVLLVLWLAGALGGIVGRP